MDESALLLKMRQALLSLSGEDGFRASDDGPDSIGRYTALATLLLVHAHTVVRDDASLDMCKKSLRFLAQHRGTTPDAATGEEPGKFPNRIIRSGGTVTVRYDAVDVTPLAVVAIHRLWEATHDDAFLSEMLPAVRAGIDWMRMYLDSNEDGLADFTRLVAGRLQSWMDAPESIIDAKTERLPPPPLAHAEVQAYAWLAFKLWGEFYAHDIPDVARELVEDAEIIKQEFNRRFIYRERDNLYYAAQAVDGRGRQIKNATANPALALAFAISGESGRHPECIIDIRFIYDIVRRIFKYDLFDPEAGIRTMSKLAPAYSGKQSARYTGGFWPGQNALIFEGLLAFGYNNAAAVLRAAALAPLASLGTPVELYIKNELRLVEYKDADGHGAATVHLWSVAAAIDLLVSRKLVPAAEAGIKSMEPAMK